MTWAQYDGLRRPDRVFITGGAGSGKTTVGHALAQRWSLPHYEMDLGRHDEAVTQSRWVVEGGGLWDVERYLDIADQIVWLDLSPVVTIPRIVTRHVTLSLRRQNRHRGLRLLARFVRSQASYYRDPAHRPTEPLDYSQTPRGHGGDPRALLGPRRPLTNTARRSSVAARRRRRSRVTGAQR